MKTTRMQESTMVEKDHEGDDEILCLNTNITKSDKFFHIYPKLWPPIILRD
jgi:hypothetical protein